MSLINDKRRIIKELNDIKETIVELKMNIKKFTMLVLPMMIF